MIGDDPLPCSPSGKIIATKTIFTGISALKPSGAPKCDEVNVDSSL